MIERISDIDETHEDKLLSLRPLEIKYFIGQSIIKNNLDIYTKAAIERKEPIDHILLSGPPGLGKTTLANILAKEMNTNLKSTAAPVIEKTGDMAAILSSIKKYDILFIDEIHRLKPVIEELLYSAMEDYFIDIQLGQGITTKTVKIDIPPFTLIGATTRPGSLTQPLISRFGILEKFQYYQTQDLEIICKNNALKLNIQIDKSGSQEIAKRSRGTPRILNRLLRRVRDYAQIKKTKIIDKDMADYALNQMNIDSRGLDANDRRLLHVLINNFSGGPVGLDNLATSINEDSSTVEDMIEPYLIQMGFIKRSPRGRVATKLSYSYLNLNDEPSLFDSINP